MGGLLIFVAIFTLFITTQFSLLLLAKLCIPWLKAREQGVPVSLYRVILWRMTGVSSQLMIETYLQLEEEGHATPLTEIEAVYRTQLNPTQSPSLLAALVRQEMHGVD